MKKVVTLTLFEVEDRLHLGKTQIKFGFSLDLHYLCRRNNKPAYSGERRVFGNLVTCFESRGLTKHYGGKGKQNS